MVILTVLTIVRLVSPVLILRKPFLGMLFAIGVDAIDYLFYPFGDKYTYHSYQLWDKFLDVYAFSFAYYVSRDWLDLRARLMAHLAYGWRLVGLIVFYLTANKELFAFFPNVLEGFYLSYYLMMWINNDAKVFLTWGKAILFTGVLTFAKVYQEIVMHVTNAHFYELVSLRIGQTVFRVPLLPSDPTVLFHMLIIGGLPLAALWGYAREVDNQHELEWKTQTV